MQLGGDAAAHVPPWVVTLVLVGWALLELAVVAYVLVLAAAAAS